MKLSSETVIGMLDRWYSAKAYRDGRAAAAASEMMNLDGEEWLWIKAWRDARGLGWNDEPYK